MFRILTLNPGSTSTKMALFDGEEKLFEERDIIVSLAIDTLKDLVDSGYNFKESEASRRYIEIKRKELHSAEAFLHECCELRTDGKVSKQALLRAYEVWSEHNGIICIGRNEFYDTVRRFDTRIRDQKVGSTDSRVNGFSGIALKGSGLIGAEQVKVD